jgi:type 1 glutamine amidotransferase
MNRREMLMRSGAAALTLGLSRFPLGWAAPADNRKRRVLMYTKSEGYQHDVVKRHGDKLSLAETIVTDLGKQHGFEVTCEKDGRVFLSDTIKNYDGFLFETQGDLTKEKSVDGQPPMTAEGKKVLLQAIADGKGFVGCHCASDTFHSPGNRAHTQERDQLDPYIAMIGGEFIVHGAQQKSRMRVIDREFPGATGLTDFDLKEEWYALKNFAPDLHVILVEDNEGMTGPAYQRPDFPATWARMHHKGRVFYTSMGHRDDVWQKDLFQALLLGGLSWALGNVQADITPNLAKAAPRANELPKEPKK